MTTLTDTELQQIANIVKSKQAAGLTIHLAEIGLGRIFFTIESRDGGDVWSPDVLTVNGMPHVLMGRYRIVEKYGYDDAGVWQSQPTQPLALIGGYPGLRRKDATKDFQPAPPTENATAKISRALGAAIAPAFEDPTEATANEREMAAQDYERRAKDAERQAERELERAMDYHCEAALIRNGGDYERRVA